MLWFIYSLICAFFLATTDSLSKKAFEGNDEYLIAWVRLGFAVPLFFIALPSIAIPSIDATFWGVILLLPLEITAIILYVKASPLSLAVPFLALTPIFLLVASFLILGEFPDKSGVLGIFLIAIGAYLLNIHTRTQSFWEPIRAILKEKGKILMIVVVPVG